MMLDKTLQFICRAWTSYSSLMLDSPQLPSVVDLSFDYNGNKTRFNIVHFCNVDVVIISDIEKIGQIVHVSYALFSA